MFFVVAVVYFLSTNTCCRVSQSKDLAKASGSAGELAGWTIFSLVAQKRTQWMKQATVPQGRETLWWKPDFSKWFMRTSEQEQVERRSSVVIVFSSTLVNSKLVKPKRWEWGHHNYQTGTAQWSRKSGALSPMLHSSEDGKPPVIHLIVQHGATGAISPSPQLWSAVCVLKQWSWASLQFCPGQEDAGTILTEKILFLIFPQMSESSWNQTRLWVEWHPMWRIWCPPLSL